MPIFFSCMYCKANVKVAEEHAGKEGLCPMCGKRLKTPTIAPAWSVPPKRLGNEENDLDVGMPLGRSLPPDSSPPAAPLPPDNRRVESNLGVNWQWLSGVGAAVLLLGLFSPVVEGPLGFSRNYFNLKAALDEQTGTVPLNARRLTIGTSHLSLMNGMAVVLLILIAAVATMARSPRVAGIVSVVIGALLMLALLYYGSSRAELNNPDVIRLSWGWALLWIGDGLIFVGAVLGCFPPGRGE